jgi:arginyl-tRNA synthetase
MVTTPYSETIRSAVRQALSAAAADGSLPALDDVDFVVERPRDRAHGDWSVNVAMTAAKRVGRPPRDIAAAVVSHLGTIPHQERVEVAGPGFINFTLAPSWYHDVLHRAALGGPGERSLCESEWVREEIVAGRVGDGLSLTAPLWVLALS